MNKKGEKAGYSRSLPRKATKGWEPGIRNVRQEGKRSFRWKQECNGRATNWEDTNRWQSSSERWDFQVEWESSNGLDSDAFESNEHWDDTGNSESGKRCEYFQSGYCHWGSSCYFSHDWNGTNENEQVASNIPAGVVFLLDGEAAEVMGGKEQLERLEAQPELDGTGPLRVRIVGDIEELGFSEGKWDPNLGVDLCWEGDGWRSMVIKVSPESFFHFCVVRVDQPESHPGLLQGWARWEMHTARDFTWSQSLAVQWCRKVYEIVMNLL